MPPFTALRPDGSEGTATCTMTVRDETNGIDSTKLLQGCMVSSKDENLKSFIQSGINPKDDKNIFLDHAYFFYAPYDEIIAKQAEKTVIQYPRYDKPIHYEREQYLLERKVHSVVVVKSHIFILCESEKLNKCPFLKERSIKKLGLNQSLEEKVYGLGKIGDNLYSFIKMKIKKCKSSSNEYEVEGCWFANKDQNEAKFKDLLIAGPILLADRQTLVGSFKKVDEESCRISCSLFEVTGVDSKGNQNGSKNEEKEGSEHNSDLEDGDDTGANNPKISGGEPIQVQTDKEPQPSTSDQENSIRPLQTSKLDSSDSYESKTETKKLQLFGRGNSQHQKQWTDHEELVWEYRHLKQQNEKLVEENKQLQKQQNEKLEEENKQLKMFVIILFIIILIITEVLTDLRLFFLVLLVLAYLILYKFDEIHPRQPKKKN